MLGDLLVRLFEALETAKATVLERGEADVVSIMREITCNHEQIWFTVKDGLAEDQLAAIIKLKVLRPANAELAQPWLPFPNFEHIPQVVQIGGESLDLRNATLDQYRKRTNALDAKIKSYAYSRRSGAKLKHDKRELKEMRRLDRVLARYFANAPGMTMGRAAELHLEYLKSPVVARNRRLASAGGKAKSRKARNQ